MSKEIFNGRRAALSLTYDNSMDCLKGLVDMAVTRGHWIILTFHGVAETEGRLTIAESTHNAQLNHCKAHGSDLWVAPVRDVMGTLA